MKSYKLHWKKLIEKELGNYNDVADSDPFDRWSKLITHEGQIESCFTDGLELLCGDAEMIVAKKHFSRCVTMADRAIAETVYQTNQAALFFPINRARILRAKCYANWFLKGQLQRDLLIQASKDINMWCSSLTDADWDTVNQERYLSGISMLIIGDDEDGIERANPVRPCRERKAQRLAVMAVIEARKGSNSISVEQFDPCFDRIRKPAQAELVTAFEMAILRIRYIEAESPNETTVPLTAVTRMSS